MQILFAISLLLVISIFVKYYFLYKLEKQSRKFRWSRFTGRMYMWAFPIIKEPRTQEEKRLIRAANITILVFWVLFFLILFIAFVVFAFTDDANPIPAVK